MAAGKHDFSIEQGSSFHMSVVYKDGDGNPVDITGWCARLIWKTSNNSVEIFSTENMDYSEYKFELSGAEGKLDLKFPASKTNIFSFNNAKYDLELQSDDDYYTDGGKYTVRILYGTITIVKRYSKSTDLLECQT
jgi:hypothetical protein